MQSSALPVILLVICGALAHRPTTTTELRSYICEANNCRLEFEGSRDEWVAINDNGCYLEYEADLEETIEYCPLQCNSASSAIIIEQLPETEDCTIGNGVNVIQRRNDWFLWRGEDCQKVQSTFKIGCTFDSRQGKKEEKLPMTKPKSRPEGKLKLVPASPVKHEFTLKSEEMPSTDDPLLEEVDLLLKAMFPTYRN
uniref:Secreted protein n=1 Tax=Haemonchus contortus TaxID=6289 RepID=A0A7I4YI00_HAECO|nr:Protein T06G6.6, isoform b [Haemonchus contortus]